MNRLVWYAGAYAASAAVLRLVGFGLFLWLARSLPTDAYAEFGLLYALQTGLSALAIAGVVEAVVGLLREHRSSAERSDLFAAANSIFPLLALPAALLAVVLFLVSVESPYPSVTTLVCVVLTGGLLAWSSLQAQVARLQEEHSSSLCFSFIVPLVGFSGSLLAYLTSPTLESFFLGAAAGISIALLGLKLVGVGNYEWLGRGRTFTQILLRLSPYVAIAFLGWLSGYGNNFLVKALLQSTEVARFTFALTLSSTVQLAATALNQVWSPRLFQLVLELPFDEVEARNRNAFRLQGIGLGVVGGCTLAAVPAAMAVIGGNLRAYGSMELELLLLFCSYALLIPWWHCHNYYLVNGKGEELMRIVLSTSIAGVAVWAVLMVWAGEIGIYLGFLAQMLLRTFGIVVSARKHWPIRVAWDGVCFAVLLMLVGYWISVSIGCDSEGWSVSCAAL